MGCHIHPGVLRPVKTALVTGGAGYQNHKAKEIVQIVRRVVGDGRVEIATEPTDDHRSYHISSEKVKRELGFESRRTVENAVSDLCAAFAAGRVPDPMDDLRYYNVKMMQAIRLN